MEQSEISIPVVAKFVADKGYERIMMPRRSTRGSAGYDFFANEKITIMPGDSVVVDTHIKANIDPDWVLMLFPRSGLGFKFGMSLAKTVGVIDSDYYSTEAGKGVIKAKLVNPSNVAVEIPRGNAFMQGIFMPFGITEDDNPGKADRNGNGFGSTDKKE